jgi:hypothetical protein
MHRPIASCDGFIAPDLVVIDDFGLRKLSGQASSDFYDLVVERHTRASYARYVLPTPTGPLKAIFSCRSNGQKDVYFDFDQVWFVFSVADLETQ